MASRQFKCEFSWSSSREKEWERCRREYWYSRYASWGWWKEKPKGQKYEIMIHKSLTSLPAFTGDCVHKALELWFQSKKKGNELSAKDLYDKSVEIFREGWRQSAGEDWKARPNKSIHLQEHHFGEEIVKSQTESARLLLEQCANYFVKSSDLAMVREVNPKQYLSLETLGTYLFEGVKVYAVPDFAYHDGATVHIWDWKTGKPREEDMYQLYTYALYGREKWSASLDNTVLHVAYLGEGHVNTTEVDLRYLSYVEQRMSLAMHQMFDSHYDPDKEGPIMSNWPASPESRKCGKCRFRSLCQEAKLM